jgi:hypothetical protein
MTKNVDLANEFALIEQAYRRMLSEAAQTAGPAPDLKERADAAMAYQAIGAALQAAGLTGPLSPTKLGRALEVVQGVAASYAFLGDSRTVAGALAEAEQYCLTAATKALERAPGRV